MTKRVFTSEMMATLRDLAAKGVACSVIGEAMGITAISVFRCCRKEGIDVARYTDAEAEHQRERRRAWDATKRDNRRDRRRAERKTIARAVIPMDTSPTSPVYRRRIIGIAGEMTKSQLRAELAQAVRNTAAMPVE